MLQYLNVLFEVRGSDRTQLSRCGFTNDECSETIPSLALLATAFLIQAKMPLGFLATWAHAHILLAFEQYSQVPLSWAALKSLLS